MGSILMDHRHSLMDHGLSLMDSGLSYGTVNRSWVFFLRATFSLFLEAIE